MSVIWNPWHGCHKISAGCLHCYVYRQDTAFGTEVSSSEVRRTMQTQMPLKLNRKGEYKIPSGELVYTCFTSDFWVEEADEWRAEAWDIIRKRSDLNFMIFTKRIHRFHVMLPDDWGSGYPNVCIGCTTENQEMADYRLPIFRDLPIKHRIITAAPLISDINFSEYLDDKIEEVTIGGESGYNARACNYDWVLNIRKQCIEKNIRFSFHQTGAKLEMNGHIYNIPRNKQHEQARLANINYIP